MAQQIGLQGVFDISNFDSGVAKYLSGIGQVEATTDFAASVLGKFGGISDSIFGAFDSLTTRVFNQFTRMLTRQVIFAIEKYIGTIIQASIAGTQLVLI